MAESQGPASGVPARGYSWALFEPGNEHRAGQGNQLALQHGAYSPRKVDPLASELVEAVLSDPGAAHAHAPHHRPALWSWARAQAQVQLLVEYIGDGVGDLDEDRIRAAYLLLHRAEARAATWSARLGLDPLSQSRLKRNTTAASWDMAKIMAELHRRDEQAAGAVAEVVAELEGDDVRGDGEGEDDD